MYRLIASVLCLVCVVACLGCAPQEQAPLAPQPTDQSADDSADDSKDVQRIQFAVFGKFADKLKERKEGGGRRGGEDCTGPECERPAGDYQIATQRKEPVNLFNPLALAAALSPLALIIPIGLGVGAYVLTRKDLT
jgi:hypothetical protein